jgi:hypothetical protein
MRYITERLEYLIANENSATVLGSIPAVSDMVESKRQKMSSVE